MLKKLLNNQEGLTLIELLIVIIVIGIITVVFVLRFSTDYQDRLTTTSESFSDNVRYVRNLATSRTLHHFDGDPEPIYPPGGYAINVRSNEDYYQVVAIKTEGAHPNSAGSEVLGTVQLAGDIDLRNYYAAQYVWYISFVSENEVHTNLIAGRNTNHPDGPTDPPGEDEYRLRVGNFATCEGVCHRANVLLGEESADGYTWNNIGTTYWSEYIAPVVDNPGSCFLPGTKITMADNTEKNIEDVQVGEYILGYKDGQYVKSKVNELDSPYRPGYYQLFLSDDTMLQLTNEHPVFARNDEVEDWAAFDVVVTYEQHKLIVNDLNEMTQVFTLDGWIDIVDVQYIEEQELTYNLLSVDDYTYFADGVLVHNRRPPAMEPPMDP